MGQYTSIYPVTVPAQVEREHPYRGLLLCMCHQLVPPVSIDRNSLRQTIVELLSAS